MGRIFFTTAAVLLLGAVAVQCSRPTAEGDFAAAEFFGRGLLQRQLDCKKVHPACATCRNQRRPGSRTSELVCSTCENGWRLRRDGLSKTCDCAPGLHKTADSTCSPCPAGSYCLGGNSINTNSDKTECPDGLATTFTGAKSLQQCFTEAGYGRTSVRGTNGAIALESVECPVGTYNVGGNTAGCQKCPAGLTTAGTKTTSAAGCLAPAGSYVDKGIGKLCPKGSYSTALNSATSCTACPTGITTSAEGSTSADDCKFAKRGYRMTGAATAAACPVNTYNDGETLEAGDDCFACPNGWKTKDEGADGEALCLAPPGYELVNGQTAITECEVGSYKADWNRNPCVACGTGLITAGTGSVSKDACLVPSGYGISSISPLAAARCEKNTYSMAANRPASAAARCTTCAPNMFTLDTLDALSAPNGAGTDGGYTAETDCKVAPGWGITAGGVAEKCQKGFYNEGKNRLPCQSCPAGFTTLNEESDSADDCVIRPGWYWDNTKSLATPCDIGTYSTGGDSTTPKPTSCTECATGVTTQTDESTSLDDCFVCAAGYGGASCTQCDYNSFSFGGQTKGIDCTACAAGSVSRRRSTEAAMCYSNMQDAVRDVFSTSGTWTADTSATANSGACAAACTADAACMTYRYKADQTSPACDLFKEDAAGTQELYFKLNNGADYVKYTIATGTTFGVQAAAPAAADAAACRAECTKTGDCEVASWNNNACSLRRSELDAEYVGMWAVRGNKLVSDVGL